MSRKMKSVSEQDQFIPKRNKTFYTNESKTIDFTQTQVHRRVNKPVVLVPKTLNQEKYIMALLDQSIDIVTAYGPAGTGKTYLAILAAIKSLKARECNKIILTRPKVAVEGEDHGFLPGDLNAKLLPWVRPMVDILKEFYSAKEVEEMLADEIIEFAPLGMMRGRTFKNAYIVLDEAQNAIPTSIRMLLTRIYTGSKIVITGDIEQADKFDGNNGLEDLLYRLDNRPIDGIEVCRFEEKDVQRHRLIPEILALYR